MFPGFFDGASVFYARDPSKEQLDEIDPADATKDLSGGE
jgi:hypothetical protein